MSLKADWFLEGIILGIIGVIGLIGNVMSVIIFYRKSYGPSGITVMA